MPRSSSFDSGSEASSEGRSGSEMEGDLSLAAEEGKRRREPPITYWSGLKCRLDMRSEIASVTDIQKDLLDLLNDDAYAHVDPLSDLSYLFDPHKYARHDDSIKTSRFALEAEELS